MKDMGSEMLIEGHLATLSFALRVSWQHNQDVLF